MGVFVLCSFELSTELIIFEKKNMEIIIDKPNHVVVKTSYGHYVDGRGEIYPFSVDIGETNGEQKWIEISWDDDVPEIIDNVETEILEMF